jgi:S1-C subfamily serine protease
MVIEMCSKHRWSVGSEGNKERGIMNSETSRDRELLDAYSQAVVGVVQRVAPSVIGIRGRTGDRGGSGSGFFISADGLALTNSHVVAKRKRLMARTHDGDRLDAELIGDDPATVTTVTFLPACRASLPQSQDLPPLPHRSVG